MDANKYNAMPRPELTHPYVASRQAASVIMLREAGSTLEVYVQHRAPTMDFAADAIVFPGGRTDAEDATFDFGPYAVPLLSQHATGWQKTSLGSPELSTALANSSTMLRTGVREVEEETGVQLDITTMRPWANLITPVGLPIRFDTFFYLDIPKEEVLPENITTEAVLAEWRSLDSLLEDAADNKLVIMRPTQFLLEDILRVGSVEGLLARDPVINPIRGL